MGLKYRSIGFALLLGLAIGHGKILPVAAFPYQIKTFESYREEEMQLRATIQREPKNANTYLQLGLLLESEAAEGQWSNCYAHSIQVYREAIAVAEPRAEIHFKLGQALMVDPKNSENCIIEELGDPAQIQARKQEGLSQVRRAIGLDPNNIKYTQALRDMLASLKDRGK
jgi:tetratricopeptide (TPR) repeat protein